VQRDCLGERAHHLDLVGGHRGEPHVSRAVGDPLVDGHVHGHEASSQSFLTNFENFLLLILYLFIPWTAVNLVDYYVVRRGHYAFARTIDVRAEQRLAAAEAAQLEELAADHRRPAEGGS